MSKSSFEVNTRVIFKWDDGTRRRGRVTCKLHGSRRVVTDSGRYLKVPVGKLKLSPDRVLILEGRLDRNLKSGRTYGPMMQQWLSAYGVEALYERVHTKADLNHFLRKEGKNVATRFVHIMSHGSMSAGKRSAQIELTFDDINLAEHASVFKGLSGKVIIFSCCDIGADEQAMIEVKKASGARAVIGYRKEVEDAYTNLAEVMIYDRLLRMTAASPANVVAQIGRLLHDMGVRTQNCRAKKPLLVCI